MGVNTWCNANSVSFKSHSIRVTFKICTVLGAQGICATGFRRTQGSWTAQNLKVTLIEWHLKLMLLALHQVFTPLGMSTMFFLVIYNLLCCKIVDYLLAILKYDMQKSTIFGNNKYILPVIFWIVDSICLGWPKISLQMCKSFKTCHS